MIHIKILMFNVLSFNSLNLVLANCKGEVENNKKVVPKELSRLSIEFE